MSRALKIQIFMLSLLTLLPDIALAQLKDFELNLFGGGSFYTNNNFQVGFPQVNSVIGSSQSVAPIQGTLKMDKAIRGGVRLGIYTRGHWSEEFFYSYEPSTARIIRRSPPAAPSINLPLSVHNYGVTALYYLQEDETHSFRPFLSIGVGGTVFHLSQEAKTFANNPFGANLPGIHNSNEIALNYGVGVKTRTNNWLGFRADVRGFIAPTPSFGLPKESTDPNATVFPVHGAIFNGEASAGVIFYFFNRH